MGNKNNEKKPWRNLSLREFLERLNSFNFFFSIGLATFLTISVVFVSLPLDKLTDYLYILWAILLGFALGQLSTRFIESIIWLFTVPFAFKKIILSIYENIFFIIIVSCSTVLFFLLKSYDTYILDNIDVISILWVIDGISLTAFVFINSFEVNALEKIYKIAVSKTAQNDHTRFLIEHDFPKIKNNLKASGFLIFATVLATTGYTISVMGGMGEQSLEIAAVFLSFLSVISITALTFDLTLYSGHFEKKPLNLEKE